MKKDELWPTPISSETGMRTKPFSQGGHPLSFEVGKKEGLMWRTPKAHVVSGDEEYNELFAEGITPTRPSGNKVELTLENQVKVREQYPTPRTRGMCGGSGAGEMINGLFARGAITDEERRAMRCSVSIPKGFGGEGIERERERKDYPTPIAHDAHKGVPDASLLVGKYKRDRRTELANNVTYNEDGSLSPDATEENRGQLNPDWVEWLMGWPVGWTSLEPMSKEAFEEWKRSVLDGTYWDVDPADLPKNDPRYLSRLTNKKDFRANRLEAIGNGQVPQCIFFAEGLMAWEEERK